MANITLDEKILKNQIETGKSCARIVNNFEKMNGHKYIGMHNNGGVLTVAVLVKEGENYYRTDSMKITNFNRSEDKKTFVEGLCQLLTYRASPSPNANTEFSKVALQHIGNPHRVYNSITHVKKLLDM